MTAAVATTVTAPTMISGGEDHPAKFVQIEVRRSEAGRNLLTDTRKDLCRLVPILRLTRERGEATTT